MSSKKTNKLNLLQDEAENLPHHSGVYQMFNKDNKCLYIGKAKDLKNRVLSYFNFNKLSPRIQHMMLETKVIKHILTRTEEEALLLEADLIKSLKPKYNILFRDDKSYPFLGLSLNHPFARIYKIKTKDTNNQNLFGPFTNNKTLEDLISFIQKTFKLRVCSDNTFNNRIQPCIYYQIKRCSAPCTSKITQKAYEESVIQTLELLKGNTENLKKDLEQQMYIESNNNNFELAIDYRNKLRMISNLNLKYSVILPEAINADIITIMKKDNIICIQVLKFQKGRSAGIHHYFPKHIEESSLSQIIEYFLIHFYKSRLLPDKIFCNILPPNISIITKAFNILLQKETIIQLIPETFKEVNYFAEENILMALEKEISHISNWKIQFKELSKILNININRIEAYDNSHFKGVSMLGAMIVATKQGFNTNEYRIFKLKNPIINKEDDFGTLNEVLERRLIALKYTNKNIWPNLLIIDGGKGHLQIATKVLNKFNFSSDIKAIAVVKGENRIFGKEKILLDNHNILDLTNNNELFKFILKLRDEAHRFALNSQRKSTIKQSTTSLLDNIPGIGKQKKKALLLHFGSIEAIRASTPEQIHQSTKIRLSLAKKMLEWLN